MKNTLKDGLDGKRYGTVTLYKVTNGVAYYRFTDIETGKKGYGCVSESDWPELVKMSNFSKSEV